MKKYIIPSLIALCIGLFFAFNHSEAPTEDIAFGSIFPIDDPIVGVELPQVYVNTDYTLEPCTTTVASGGNLQTAINNASYGDVLCLEAGATFTGNFTLPAKAGSSGWIVIRSDRADELPPQNRRVTPEHAYLMPKIVTANTAEAITVDINADRYRLIGLEITTTHEETYIDVVNLVDVGMAATTTAQLPEDIIFDRVYAHGTDTGSTRRGISLQAVRGAVVDSYIEDIKDTDNDSQAILIYKTPGPIKIVNNFLEGSGENVMSGGVVGIPAEEVIPSDVEIRGNHFYKPLEWKSDDPSYAGILWSVKNSFEIKAGRRFLVEGNYFENHWAAAQSGFAIVFTPRETVAGQQPFVIVEDITFRKNVIKNSHSGINIMAHDGNGTSEKTNDIAIVDNLIQLQFGTSTGRGIQILSNRTQGATDDVIIKHNTVTHLGQTMFMFDAGSGTDFSMTANTNTVIQYNIFEYGLYGVNGTGSTGIQIYDRFLSNYTLADNVFYDTPVSPYFPNELNITIEDINDVGFVSHATDDFELGVSSPYKGTANGRDYGADIALIEALAQNAEQGIWGQPQSISGSGTFSGSGTIIIKSN